MRSDVRPARALSFVSAALSVASTIAGLVACGAPANNRTTPATTSPGESDASGQSSSSSANGAAEGGASADDANAPNPPNAPTGDAGPTLCPMLVVDGGPASKWAYVDAPGHLAYASLPTGERLLDFSTAGYMGGGVAIPVAAVAQTVSPSGGTDDTPAIQAAINAVSSLPLTGSLRGAVLLAPGTFTVAGTLSIATSGVVLRGSGSGAGGTVLQITGSPRTVLSVAGTGNWSEASTSAEITDDYVPSGATTFHVSSTAGLAPGTPVLVDRPVTAGWIQFMGMNDMVRDGAVQTWLQAGSTIHADRTVVSVSGTTVTLDAPISDTFDVSTWGAGAPRATVSAYTFAGRIEQVGVESMRLIAPAQTVPISQPTYGVLSMDAVMNGWVHDVAGEEFTSGFSIGSGAKWVTVEDSSLVRVAPIDGGAGYPFHFSVDGQGVLVQRCTSVGDGVFSYATQDRTPGPNVVLAMNVPSDDAGMHTNLQPHQRWATGLLVDEAINPTGGIGLMNRGTAGSGHGWAIGFGVVWNGVADALLIQQPPGAENWSIGATGKQTTASGPESDGAALPQGIIDSPGVAVAPASLYLAQLCARLGPGALKAIGY